MEITIGLYYNGARYLAAWLGRWTSADPIGMQAGVNLYQYCRGSPINYSDPSGTDDVPATRALNEPHSTLPSGLIIPTHDDTVGDGTTWYEDKSIGTRIGELIDSLDLTANEPGQAGNATPLISNADLAYGIKIETWRLEHDLSGTDDQGHPLWEQNNEGEYEFIGDSGRYLHLPIGTSDVEVGIATGGVGEVVGAVGGRLAAALERSALGASFGEGATVAGRAAALEGRATLAEVGASSGPGGVPAAAPEELVTAFHGSVGNYSEILRRGLDANRAPTWVTTNRLGAENAIGSGRVLSPGQGLDAGVIESSMPRTQFDALIASGGISPTRSWPGFGRGQVLSENVLRSPEAIKLFNRGIKRP